MRGAIPARLLTRLKGVAARYLDSTCDLRQLTQDIGEFGEIVKRVITVATGVRCQVIRQETPATVIEGERETSQTAYRLIVPNGTPIAINQQVVIGSDVYDVIGVGGGETNAFWIETSIMRSQE